MVKFCLTVMVLGGIIFSIESAAGSMDDLKARLTSLEANQKSAREELLSLSQVHDNDVTNVTQYCQGLKTRVEQQSEVLEAIKQSMGGNNSPVSTSAPDLSGPCAEGNYEVIDDEQRSSIQRFGGYDTICDRNIVPGWYRFKLNGNNAVMPTQCVPKRRCTTDAPVWLDLQGQSLPDVGQQVDARGCAHWSSSCCNWQTDVSVRNCGDFFVYMLNPVSACSLAFCAQPQDSNGYFSTFSPTTESTTYW